MTLKTSVLLIENRLTGRDVVKKLGITGIKYGAEIGGFTKAMSLCGGRRQLAMGVVGNWTVVIDPTWRLYGDRPEEGARFNLWSPRLNTRLLRLSKSNAKIFGFVVESSVPLYGFTWYEQDWALRARIVRAGRVLQNLGEPLDAENGLENLDPAPKLFALVDRICVPLAQLNSTPFYQFTFDIDAYYSGRVLKAFGKIRQMVDGTWCVRADDSTWFKPYSNVNSESEIYDAIRTEFRLPIDSTKSDVDKIVREWFWTIERGRGRWYRWS